ncbi:retention module-containing protein, partial [Halioglobus sp. HI00S01]|uniref:retention module-containing protein n=2 Tax=Halioglobus sp. HI00S01 TaxID=1822214 RepID=UPI000A8A320D
MDEAQIAVVAGLTGKAYVRSAEGELRELSVGDALFEGETVVTPDGVMVELTLTDGSLMGVDAPEMMLSPDLVAETAPGPDESAFQDETIEAVLAALESGEDLGEVLEATAAGPSSLSGPSGEGHSFIRLGRIAESTSEFDGIGGTTGNEAEAGAEQDSTPVDAIDDEAATDAGVPVVISVENNDIFAEGEDVISISQPENGVAILNDDDTVTYIPNEGFSGTDTFTYTATNPDGTQGDTAVVTVEVNPPADPPPPPPVEPPVVEPPVVEPPVVETLPEISIGDDVVIEGGTAQVVVSIDKPWDEPISVAFETEDDTATVIGGDYDPETATITFAPGVTELVILVSTNEDNIREGSEFFNVNLSDPVNATIADGEGVVEIIDVYEDPTITIGDDIVVEGDTAQLVVSLSRAIEEEVTVDFVSADGTAIEVNGDYLGTSGTLTFAPGDTELVINVVTLDDAEDEASENMFIDLSNPTNAEIEDPQGRVTIRDNDSPPPPPPPPNEPPTAETEQVAVDEAALASGSNPGSNADTVSGQLDATDPDGDPLSFVPGVQVGTYGTLEINADGTYVYTLNSRFDTNPDADDGPVTAIGAEQFQYTVLDGNGGSDIGLVTINIIDDVPQAVDDGAYAVEEDTTESISFASLLANDTEGADQPVSVSLGSNAANGVVIVVGDTFEYTPNPGFEGADSFTYILTDADGDTSEATVLLVVDTDSEPTVSVVYAGERDWVAESALADGSNPGSPDEATSGDFNITHTGTDTTDKLEVQDKDGNYIDVTAGGVVQGEYGELVVAQNGDDYTWTYTLNGATDEHTDDAMVEEKDTLPESFAVRVTDSDGDTDDATLEIDVRDDGPQAVDDGAFDVEEDSTEVISFADVLDNDIEGADQPVSVTLGDDATNGTVVVVGETFEYTPNEGYAGPDSF